MILITKEQFIQAQKHYYDVISEPENREVFWNEMYEEILNQSVKKDREEWYGDFRWFAHITFENIVSLDKKKVLQVLPKIIPIGAMLGFDLVDTITKFLLLSTISDVELKAYYNQLKNAVLESESIIGFYQNKPYTVAEHAKKLQHLLISNNADLEGAEVKVKIKSMVITKEESELYDAALGAGMIDDALFHLDDIIVFFLKVSNANIKQYLDVIMNPEYEDQDNSIEKKISKMVLDTSIQNNVNDLEFNNKETIFDEKPKQEEPVQDYRLVEASEEIDTINEIEENVQEDSVIEDIPKKALSIDTIKMMIDSRFEKDEQGQYVNLEGVLLLLAHLAEDQQDESIRDLYYFDEQTGMFVWQS